VRRIGATECSSIRAGSPGTAPRTSAYHHDVSATSTISYEVISNTRLSADVHQLVIRAPRVASVRQPGQFVIVRLGAGAERIPLTIVESDPDEGTIVVAIQAVGKSTSDLVALVPGASIDDVVGPLGRPSDLITDGTAVCVAGGVGAAVIFPIAQRLAELNAEVITVLGARTGECVLFAEEFATFSELFVCTDDGSSGRRGLVTDALADLVAGRSIDAVYAAGPVPMMRAVAAVTQPFGVRTIVSLNPIMVDGTGMCGGCRVTVNGAMRFACVDGPEFDGHGVDFDELADRLGTYRESERVASAHVCPGVTR
jgi:ferredoxin/flavodoxin---NADP+ reductase